MFFYVTKCLRSKKKKIKLNGPVLTTHTHTHTHTRTHARTHAQTHTHTHTHNTGFDLSFWGHNPRMESSSSNFCSMQALNHTWQHRILLHPMSQLPTLTTPPTQHQSTLCQHHTVISPRSHCRYTLVCQDPPRNSSGHRQRLAVSLTKLSVVGVAPGIDLCVGVCVCIHIHM